MAGRAKLLFTPGVEVEFVDRDAALKQIEEIAERGTRFPVVIYGPEGCGKSALLRQAMLVLEEHGYQCILLDPLEPRVEQALQVSRELRGLVDALLGSIVGATAARLVDLVLKLSSIVLERLRRPRLALLLDDLFQAIGVESAERYVKMLLNLIEYPPRPYESIVILVTSSEGVTRRKIGRHGWSRIRAMWNLGREGFERLYLQLPGEKPPFNQVWALTGGNPRALARLFEASWSREQVVNELIEERGLRILRYSIGREQLELLMEALEDPDVLVEGGRGAHELLGKLVELNLVMELPSRDPHLWIDEPPPERDPRLGIGRHVAWQTPLHREAVASILRGV